MGLEWYLISELALRLQQRIQSPEATGAQNSSINTTTETIRFDRFGTRSAFGLRNTNLSTGFGSDVINILAVAESKSDYSYYVNKGSYSFSGKNSGRSSGTYSYANSNTAGTWSNTYSYSRTYDYQWDWSGTSSHSWLYSYNRGIQSTGDATGVQNSSINTGSGNDKVMISAIGTRSAFALDNASIRTGTGNDNVVINGTVLNSVIKTGTLGTMLSL